METGDLRLHHFCNLLKDQEVSQERLVEYISHCSENFLEEDYEDERGVRARWLCIHGLH